MYLLCTAALRNVHISLFFLCFFLHFFSRKHKMLDLKHPTGERLFPREKSFVDLLNKETIHAMWASLNIGWILEDLFYYNIAINDIWDDKIILFVMPFFLVIILCMCLYYMHFFFISLTDSPFLIQQTSVDKILRTISIWGIHISL